ncbi:MAG: monovalent cation/H+ antiporter subunit D family protein, partial [Nannocystaceae bacterium]
MIGASPELAIAIPMVGAIAIALTGAWRNIREGVTLLTAGLLFATVLSLVPAALDGPTPSTVLLHVLPEIPLAFHLEPLGMIYALIASGLWILNSIYSIGYMRGNREANQTRFYLCFALSIASVMGIAFSANMLTLFICYETLSLVTYPLVTHKAPKPAAVRAGRTYLGILVSASV